MEKILKNQIALITGGSGGIGFGIAKEFAKQGASVVLFGQNKEKGERASQELQKDFPDSRFLFMSVDVKNEQDVKEGIKKVLEAFSHIDILVNNAGITRDQLIIRMSEEDWDLVIDTNLKSCYLVTKEIVKSMMKRRRGKIINISSIVGLMGNPGQANYAASKSGMIGMTKTIAKEYAGRGIQVNCIAPGFIQTDMTDALSEDQKKKTLETIPAGRFGQVEEIAHSAVFLASSLSDYITGHVLSVDGGMAM